jgi:hypothetical protein
MDVDIPFQFLYYNTYEKELFRLTFHRFYKFYKINFLRRHKTSFILAPIINPTPDRGLLFDL